MPKKGRVTASTIESIDHSTSKKTIERSQTQENCAHNANRHTNNFRAFVYNFLDYIDAREQIKLYV